MLSLLCVKLVLTIVWVVIKTETAWIVQKMILECILRQRKDACLKWVTMIAWPQKQLNAQEGVKPVLLLFSVLHVSRLTFLQPTISAIRFVQLGFTKIQPSEFVRLVPMTVTLAIILLSAKLVTDHLILGVWVKLQADVSLLKAIMKALWPKQAVVLLVAQTVILLKNAMYVF